jgi:hypothetical protein
MSTFFNDMQAALDARLDAMDSTPIAWPNVPYEPSAGTTYVRPQFLPTETVQASLGASGKDETNAVYQVDVVYPRGAGRATLTDTIADHFKRGTVLSYNGTSLRVRSVSIGPAILDGAWVFVPVSIDVQTYTGARS